MNNNKEKALIVCGLHTCVLFGNETVAFVKNFLWNSLANLNALVAKFWFKEFLEKA